MVDRSLSTVGFPSANVKIFTKRSHASSMLSPAVFTVPTSVGGVMQCPEACEDLQHGFIHRDLMPPITHVVPETGNEW
ncbi:hypothetical protein KIN20_030746 [Parelaphostrongylus tenuis]|uniref:Uncharacterized protein n=1 Tax=Parelaphostrongylus tenuis TaxID=148309 RepID=A0AAD5WGM5_PARTN|nr:hypothetical protein KIN20_030746 [Parelaphostrongylus tenuis]